MSDTRTLYLDLVPATQDGISAAVERIETVGLAAAGAVRHVVEPYVEAVMSTRRYLSVDHTRVVDATVGYAGRFAEQRQRFLSELGDVLLGKQGSHRAAKARSSAAA